MAELKLLDQRHHESIRVTYISMKTPNKGYNEVYDLSKNIESYNMGWEIPFSEKIL